MWIKLGEQRGRMYVRGLSVFQKCPKLSQYKKREDRC